MKKKRNSHKKRSEGAQLKMVALMHYKHVPTAQAAETHRETNKKRKRRKTTKKENISRK